MKILKVDLIYMLTTPQQIGRCGTNIHVWYIHNTHDVRLALLSSHWSPAPMSLISAAALYLVINSLPPLTPTDCSTLLLNAKTLQIYLGLVCTLYMQQKTWKAKIINPSLLYTFSSNRREALNITITIDYQVLVSWDFLGGF